MINNTGEYFQDKYRVKTTRLSHWDYASEGLYYVTICTKDRICCLCNIKDDRVYLSEIGKIVHEEWLETPIIRPDVLLDDFIIMPNHVHGIIKLPKNNDFDTQKRRDAQRRVSTREFGPLQPKSLSAIINNFKGSVKRKCNQNDLAFFTWQSRYYEHIIRDEDDLAHIKKYIANNPIKWSEDRNNPININV